MNETIRLTRVNCPRVDRSTNRQMSVMDRFVLQSIYRLIRSIDPWLPQLNSSIDLPLSQTQVSLIDWVIGNLLPSLSVYICSKWCLPGASRWRYCRSQSTEASIKPSLAFVMISLRPSSKVSASARFSAKAT